MLEMYVSARNYEISHEQYIVHSLKVIRQIDKQNNQ